MDANDSQIPDHHYVGTFDCISKWDMQMVPVQPFRASPTQRLLEEAIKPRAKNHANERSVPEDPNNGGSHRTSKRDILGDPVPPFGPSPNQRLIQEVNEHQPYNKNDTSFDNMRNYTHPNRKRLRRSIDEGSLSDLRFIMKTGKWT